MTNETIFIIKLISRKSTNREFTILIYKIKKIANFRQLFLDKQLFLL